MEDSTHKVVIVWDMIKENLKKSEEYEFARIIGNQIIETNQDLRAELENYMEIINDMQNSYEENLDIETEQKEAPKQKLFLNKNNEFLRNEISFFISDLRAKAKSYGLDEDMLIPLKSKRDVQIYSYVQSKNEMNSRPMTASTFNSSKQYDACPSATESLSSTFSDGFPKKECEYAKVSLIPKDKCVLDFEKSEIEILKEISCIMESETKQLEEQIKIQQEMIMNGGKPLQSPIPSKVEEPSNKELVELKSRLEKAYLNSDKEASHSALLHINGDTSSGSSPHNSELNESILDLKNKKLKFKLGSIKQGSDLSKDNDGSHPQLKLARAMTGNPVARKKIKLKKVDESQLSKKAMASKGSIDCSLQRSQVVIPKTEIYGLDIDLLKAIGQDHTVQELCCRKHEPTKEADLRKNILALEIKYKKPTKLREICKEFRG